MSPRPIVQTAVWSYSESRLCQCLSSQRGWCPWATSGDLAFPRDRAVTFVTQRAKSVAVCSSCINFGSKLPSCICLSALADLQDSHGMQGRGGLVHSTVSFGGESRCQLTGFGWETRMIPPSGGVLRAQVDLSTYPLAAPPSMIVRMEEADEKGSGHDFVSSSCTSGKKDTSAGCSCEPRHTRNNFFLAVKTKRLRGEEIIHPLGSEPKI